MDMLDRSKEEYSFIVMPLTRIESEGREVDVSCCTAENNSKLPHILLVLLSFLQIRQIFKNIVSVC